jgi:reverse gyrase
MGYIMKNLQRNAMKAIKMNRAELLDIVRSNAEKHVSEFNEAVGDYKKLALQTALTNAELAKTAELEEFRKIKSHPTPPQSYEDSYRRAIRMLELSIDDIIEIEEDIFNQLVLDEWSWKRGFVTTNSMYKIGT